MPKINLANFREVIVKATLNNSIETVQLVFDNGKIRSKMVSKNSQCVTQLNVDNNVIDSDEFITFNFNEPFMEVLPFVDLIDANENEADIIIRDEKISVKSGSQNIDLHFCSENVVKVFPGDDVKIETPQHITMDVDEKFIEGYEKAKRIAARFKKIYFNVKDNVLSMEASDMTNMFTNRFKYELMETEQMEDFTVCFDFRNFVNLMKVISYNPSLFNIGFLYVTEQELGMMQAKATDGSEKYFLMSRNF